MTASFSAMARTGLAFPSDHNGISSNDPELHCPTCSSKFFRSGIQVTAPQGIADQLEEN
jgi:hypothetical protein